MRVIAGSAKSHRLSYPRGADIRPTTDAMREALFSSLGDRVDHARFADLYAGCGSVGIEALSRGACYSLFVEKDARCKKAIDANLQATRLGGLAKVVRAPVERVWSHISADDDPFDIVFADPPYGLSSFGDFALRLVQQWEGVAPGGLVVLQYGAGSEQLQLPPSTRTKQFGETVMMFYERD